MITASMCVICGTLLMVFGLPGAYLSKHEGRNAAIVFTLSFLFFLAAGIIYDIVKAVP